MDDGIPKEPLHEEITIKKDGWLSKLDPAKNTWDLFYFVLKRGRLARFELKFKDSLSLKTDMQPRETTPQCPIMHDDVIDIDLIYPYSFTLGGGINFSAETKEERDAWLKSLYDSILHSDDRATMCGWLARQKGPLQWQSLYFTLRNRKLYIFDFVRKGFLKLQFVSAKECISQGPTISPSNFKNISHLDKLVGIDLASSYEFRFSVATRHKVFDLAAKSREEMLSWVDAVEKAINEENMRLTLTNRLIYDTEKIPVVNEEEVMNLCRMWNSNEIRDCRASAFGFKNLSLNEANLEIMNSFSILQYIVDGLLHKDPHISKDTARALYHFSLYDRYHSKFVEELKVFPRVVTLLKIATDEEIRKDVLGILYNLSKSGKYRAPLIQELQKINIDDLYDDNKKAFQTILNALHTETPDNVAAQFVRETTLPEIVTKEVSLLDLDDIPESQQTNIVESRPKTRTDMLRLEDRPKVKRMNSDDFFNALDSTSSKVDNKKPPTAPSSKLQIFAPPSAVTTRQDSLSPTGTRASRSKSFNPPPDTAPIAIQTNLPSTTFQYAGSPPSPLKSLGLSQTNTYNDNASTHRMDLAVPQDPQTRGNRSRSVTEKLGDAFSKVVKLPGKKTYNSIEESAQFIESDY